MADGFHPGVELLRIVLVLFLLHRHAGHTTVELVEGEAGDVEIEGRAKAVQLDVAALAHVEAAGLGDVQHDVLHHDDLVPTEEVTDGLVFQRPGDLDLQPGDGGVVPLLPGGDFLLVDRGEVLAGGDGHGLDGADFGDDLFKEGIGIKHDEAPEKKEKRKKKKEKRKKREKERRLQFTASGGGPAAAPCPDALNLWQDYPACKPGAGRDAVARAYHFATIGAKFGGRSALIGRLRVLRSAMELAVSQVHLSPCRTV